jgi:hypothetical protein
MVEAKEGNENESKQTVLCMNKCLLLWLQILVVVLARIEGKKKFAILFARKCLQYRIIPINLSAQINRKILIFS